MNNLSTFGKLLVLLTIGVCLSFTNLSAKTLRWAFQADSQTLDPHSLNESFLLGFMGNVYEGLTSRNENLEIEPGLAESWKVMEPTRWRFYLRKGVKFHNGNGFNADDVIFTYNRTKTEGSDVKARVSSITEAIKVDNYTVDFVTKQPNPILNAEWDTWYIMDKEWSESHGASEAANVKSGKESYTTRNTNGTGAFMLQERQRDVRTVLVPNPNWWKKSTHNLTKVVFTPISSGATRVAALLSGEIDMMYPVPVQDIRRINSNSSTSVLQGPELRTIFLGFDVKRNELVDSNVKGKNPFHDIRVRKAFYQAINIVAIQKKIMRGLSDPSALMISPKLFPSYSSQFKRYSYDRKASKELLAQAGYPNGFEVTMDCPNDRYVNDEEICQAVVSMLAKVGVKINLQAVPKANYFPKVLAYNTSFFLLGWTPGSLDSHNVLHNLIATQDKDSGRGKFNLGGYSNTTIDSLADKILSETDIGKRDAMIRDAFQSLHDDVGYIPLHQQALAWGKSNKVSLKQTANNQFSFYWVNID
ncbi:MAG: ABC transporter substrate-binding protein [Proteobacteria bacterium]|nr:ABC transporter substrate-binding protein [Pseudomonadota bacterium]